MDFILAIFLFHLFLSSISLSHRDELYDEYDDFEALQKEIDEYFDEKEREIEELFEKCFAELDEFEASCKLENGSIQDKAIL